LLSAGEEANLLGRVSSRLVNPSRRLKIRARVTLRSAVFMSFQELMASR